MGFGKGRRTAGQFDIAAIEMGSKQRLHLDIRLVGQAGDEGYPDVDVAQAVALTHRAIIELHQATVDLDVIDREAGRRRIGGLQPFVQQIGNVVAPLGHPGHPDAGLVQTYLIDDHAPVGDGGQGEIHVQVVEAEHFVVGLILHRDAPQGGGQGIGIDIHPRHRHLAVQLLG